MPYRWNRTEEGSVTLHLWPNRSLPRRGYVWFIALTAGMLAIPVLSQFGAPTLWWLLPFPVLAVWGLIWAFERSYRAGHMQEVLEVAPDGAVLLTRFDPDGSERHWHANAYWIRIQLHENGPVESYLTLSGGQPDAAQRVELGRFLSPEERLALAGEVRRAISAARR